MDILVRALHSKGHSITVLRNTKSWYIKEDSSYYDSITVPIVQWRDKEFAKEIISKIFTIEQEGDSILNFISMQLLVFSATRNMHAVTCQVLSTMLEDRALMQRLNESQFDLVLADPGYGDGIILAHYLKVPLVYNARFVLSEDGHFILAPSPVSYIPTMSSGLSDKMTFLERVKNVLFYLKAQFQRRFIVRPVYQAVCDKYFEDKVDMNELVQAADIWLMRVDFVFEFPRPTMPNVVYMGGFQCKPAQPLPQDLHDFVQSSGEHGVILMSLGTYVSDLPRDFADSIASAFAELPQKVIWRHIGERPSTLGNNTLLVKWIPQNDLLGNPQIRAFVAHGGGNGVQEAIYHGVPVLGIPLFFDQHDNLLRLEEKGGAKVLPIASVNKANVLRALQEVLHVSSYRQSMQRLSHLHRDQPVEPLDRALFWIQFVMRHKGAAHLRTESYKMPWYSYHSLDVTLFLLVVLFLMLFIVFALVRCALLRLCGRSKSKKD
ncbi:UDP-glucuronosyltransferase 2B1-like [Engraulis encrasicolus]|uniref:UDP-glucuronosyltransferase 2B1-like n=1 Tax=Engraulis encrasicolus TaxID=184585 RepID=UPI002FD1EAB4